MRTLIPTSTLRTSMYLPSSSFILLLTYQPQWTRLMCRREAGAAPSAGGSAVGTAGPTPRSPLRLRLAASPAVRAGGGGAGPEIGLLGAAPIMARIAEPGDEVPAVGAAGGGSTSCHGGNREKARGSLGSISRQDRGANCTERPREKGPGRCP